MPNSLQSSAIASPASRRATNCSLSSITEHSFQGITTSPSTERKCHLCVRYNVLPMSQVAQPANQSVANLAFGRLLQFGSIWVQKEVSPLLPPLGVAPQGSRADISAVLPQRTRGLIKPVLFPAVLLRSYSIQQRWVAVTQGMPGNPRQTELFAASDDARDSV